MRDQRGYFSLFSAIAIVLMAYFMFSIYSLHSSIALEGQSTTILLDELYFARKNAEGLFWQAAINKSNNQDKMVAWEKLAESSDLSISAWVGDQLNTSQLSCNLTWLKDQSNGKNMHDEIENSNPMKYEFTECIGGNDKAKIVPCERVNVFNTTFVAVVCLNEPETITYFSAQINDFKYLPTT
ncbi:hypothetical protein ACFLQI_01470 [Candidatus Undinarchaeota archaeon]